jgi:EAL domain-containing protein (putative c-di-GMP-specific phosphodiesterase class I)|tara:strand:+ start:3196 stop:3306 length:111 start_codon:yes stop_codon:yes gene_type:complete
VLELITSNEDSIIIKSITDLAHNLGLSVVAEGVENK